MTVTALLQALHNPAAYPEPTTAVEMRETHISVVFLTDHYVYKLKKPLNLGFLDYSTLEQRRSCCEQELTLNRRLSTNVYLDLAPLYDDGHGYTFTPTGPVVDYAVKMRRLPSEATLEALLSRGDVAPPRIDDLAHSLAMFHATHDLPASAEDYGTHAQVYADWQENFVQAAESLGSTISQQMYTRIQQAVMTFLTRRAAWFAQRVHDGRIRDCHGDLRAEHIYLEGDQLQIIDCIEFNTRFRYIDTVSEIAFLAMDLERIGFPTVARDFVAAYVRHSGDVSLYRLLDFYRCYRAYVRGKVRSIRLQEAPPAPERPRLQTDAERCFALADRYAQRLTRPMLIMTTGLIGSGKSSVAAGIATALDLRILSSDRLRKEQAGLSPETPQHVAYGTGLYSASSRLQTYEALADLARGALSQGESVILDAAFPTQTQRQRVRTVAWEQGADCYVLECRVPEAVLRARLDQRQRTPGVISDGRWEIFEQFQKHYEPVQEMHQTCHIRLETTQPVGQCVQQALAAIQDGRL